MPRILFLPFNFSKIQNGDEFFVPLWGTPTRLAINVQQPTVMTATWSDMEPTEYNLQGHKLKIERNNDIYHLHDMYILRRIPDVSSESHVESHIEDSSH